MDITFLSLLMEKTQFPQEAQAFLLQSAERLARSDQEQALDGAVDFFYENDFSIELTQPLVETLSKAAGMNPYTVWLLLLMDAAKIARQAYLERGVPEDVVWDTFSDFRCKALECKEIHDVWGTFVAFWYPIFYSCDIVKLGRLEYENIRYPWDEPYTCGSVTVKKGDPVKNIHIPSSGEPFDQGTRLASYELAYNFFKDELNGGPLVCVCHSWLLYPEYGKLLAPGSNIRGFQDDFDLVGWEASDAFHDAWRLYGRAYQQPTGELPEGTAMQRAVKRYLLAGGRPGEGRGVLLFDGERIVNRK